MFPFLPPHKDEYANLRFDHIYATLALFEHINICDGGDWCRKFIIAFSTFISHKQIDQIRHETPLRSRTHPSSLGCCRFAAPLSGYASS